MKQLTLFGEHEEVALSRKQTVASISELLKNRPKPDPQSPIVVSYGGGVNSTAMLIAMLAHGIKPDLILFADTGSELPETYEYIEEFSEWLISKNFPAVQIVRRKPIGLSFTKKVTQRALDSLQLIFKNQGLFSVDCLIYAIWWLKIKLSPQSTLLENCLINETLPSVAYGRKSCSLKWKIEAQDSFVENELQDLISQGIKIRKLIGYHAGEQERLLDKTGSLRTLEDKAYRYEYPLITLGLHQEHCKALILSVGLSIPPKSSCIFCPNRKITEIKRLPEELKLLGILMEQTARDGVHGLEGIKGLGRKFSWSELDKATPLELAGWQYNQNTRKCGCID